MQQAEGIFNLLTSWLTHLRDLGCCLRCWGAFSLAGVISPFSVLVSYPLTLSCRYFVSFCLTSSVTPVSKCRLIYVAERSTYVSILSPPSFFLFPLSSMAFNLGYPVGRGCSLYQSPFLKRVAIHFIFSMDLCVLFSLTFHEAQPQEPLEVTVQTQMQFVNSSLDFSMHRIKYLVLIRHGTMEFGYLGQLCNSCEK